MRVLCCGIVGVGVCVRILGSCNSLLNSSWHKRFWKRNVVAGSKCVTELSRHIFANYSLQDLLDAAAQLRAAASKANKVTQPWMKRCCQSKLEPVSLCTRGFCYYRWNVKYCCKRVSSGLWDICIRLSAGNVGKHPLPTFFLGEGPGVYCPKGHLCLSSNSYAS